LEIHPLGHLDAVVHRMRAVCDAHHCWNAQGCFRAIAPLRKSFKPAAGIGNSSAATATRFLPATPRISGSLFPLVFLFPRYRIPLLIIPLFISVARVGVNDHWCSDVFGSIAIAAAVTLFFIQIFRMKPAQTAREPSLATAESRETPRR